MKGYIRLVKDGGGTQGEWEKHMLIELGLSKRLVDKMSTDDAKLALQDILGIVKGQAIESILSSISSSIKLYPHKTASRAQKALGQIETKVRGIDYSVASTISTQLASKGFNIATASIAKKCKPLLKTRSLRVLFDHADNKSGEDSLSDHDVGKARSAPIASFNEQKKEKPDKPSSENILAAGMSDIKSWEEKGDILFKLGLFGESADCYSRFLEIHPANVEAWNKKGSCLFNMAKYLEAATCFDNALVIDNASASAWYGKACTAIKTFQTDSALHCLEKTVEYGEGYRKIISKSRAFSLLKNDARFSRLSDPQNSTSSFTPD